MSPPAYRRYPPRHGHWSGQEQVSQAFSGHALGRTSRLFWIGLGCAPVRALAQPACKKDICYCEVLRVEALDQAAFDEYIQRVVDGPVARKPECFANPLRTDVVGRTLVSNGLQHTPLVRGERLPELGVPGHVSGHHLPQRELHVVDVDAATGRPGEVPHKIREFLGVVRVPAVVFRRCSTAGGVIACPVAANR